MGKNKVKKRTSLQKQFVISYAMILVLSMLTSVAAILAFYFFYHQGTDMNSLTSRDLTKILDYSVRMGSSIQSGNGLKELDRLVNETGLVYDIKDMNNNVLFSSEASRPDNKDQNGFMKRLSKVRNNFVHTSSINVPLVDKSSGSISSILVVKYPGHLIFIDILIPFVCLVLYTILFSGSFSSKIRKPLNELMEAVKKIKGRDLDFKINNDQEDEIGDLSRAFEEMRNNLKNSLIREWQLEQDRRDMVAAIAHDLRTPLAIIKGHVEGLQDGLKKNETKLDEYLGIIEQNSSRAVRLIDDMNSLAEIDSSGFLLNSQEMDLLIFLNSKFQELKVLASIKQIYLETTIDDKRASNRLIKADSLRLSQIMDNIVGNSIRFTPAGGNVQINVHIDENRASFRISDTGQGFSEQDLANLFKKFYKGDNSRSMEKGHSGLGLYISKSIVEKFGGGIKAVNTPQGGACLDFYILF